MSFFISSRIKRFARGLALGLSVGVCGSLAMAQGVIKIGEINSYKAQPAFLEPYKKGMELALEEINGAGGVNGRKLQLILRDDNANPGMQCAQRRNSSRASRSMC